MRFPGCPYRRRVISGPTPPDVIDFQYQYLRSYFSIQDWNPATNVCVSRPSLGDSGTRPDMTNGSLLATREAVPGTSEFVMRVPTGAGGTWARLQGVAINTSLYIPNLDYMWTVYLNFTQDPIGTDGGFGVPSTRIFSDTQTYCGAYAFRNGGQNYVGAQHVLTLGSTVEDQKVTVPVPDNVGFVMQYGLINGNTVLRINLDPWVEATNPLPGGTYAIAGQNFHLGYSTSGATYYFRGDCGNLVSTIGNYDQSVYDQLSYKMMLDYGVAL